MKSIGVPLLEKTALPTDEAEVLQQIMAKYEASAYLRINREILDLTSQSDLEQLADYAGEKVHIVVDGGQDAGSLLNAVHSELVKCQCCY